LNKRDRIAVALSAIYMLFPLVLIFGGTFPARGVVALVPLLAYWGYRFVKNDISFIKNSSPD